MANVRKLVAIDIVFLGFKVVVAEYACGVLLSIALGIFVLFRSRSAGQAILGVYFLCLGINYLPLFVYARSIRSKERARGELGTELIEKRSAMAKYRRFSLLLLVPLVIPILAITRKPG
jgi:hypothetical protein